MDLLLCHDKTKQSNPRRRIMTCLTWSGNWAECATVNNNTATTITKGTSHITDERQRQASTHPPTHPPSMTADKLITSNTFHLLLTVPWQVIYIIPPVISGSTMSSHLN